jgi:hypothetical protein
MPGPRSCRGHLGRGLEFLHFRFKPPPSVKHRTTPPQLRKGVPSAEAPLLIQEGLGAGATGVVPSAQPGDLLVVKNVETPGRGHLGRGLGMGGTPMPRIPRIAFFGRHARLLL